MTAQLPLIVAAPDSFKGSCSAALAAQAMIAGARSVWGEQARYLALPLADGGEGTLEAMLSAWNQPALTTPTTDAIGRARNARFGLSADGATALIEAAEANGLPWVMDEPLQPLDADSFGVGTIAMAALDAGATELLICLGGSATSDGGTGMLRALGVRFLDVDGHPVAPGARGLRRIARVDASHLDSRVRDARWRIAVDVVNPLCGPDGAAHVFGPQKGASSDDVPLIDAGLDRFARVLAAMQGVAPSDYLEKPGLGAAGGLALALVALCRAELVSGSEMVADALRASEVLGAAALILTGEGRLDAQSLGGKVIDMVRQRACESTPVVVIAGAVELSAAECRAAGITAALSIATGPASLDTLRGSTIDGITETAAHVCALLTAELPPARL